MSGSLLSPMPQAEPLVSDAKGTPLYMNGRWLQWFYLQWNQNTTATPIAQGSALRLTAQSASIGTTAMRLPQINGGRYRISWYARITVADAVSSSLTVTIGWTESGLALTASGAALTGNTPFTVQSGSIVAELDGNSPITYATAYVSNTPGQMNYRLSIEVEALP